MSHLLASQHFIPNAPSPDIIKCLFTLVIFSQNVNNDNPLIPEIQMVIKQSNLSMQYVKLRRKKRKKKKNLIKENLVLISFYPSKLFVSYLSKSNLYSNVCSFQQEKPPALANQYQ